MPSVVTFAHGEPVSSSSSTTMRKRLGSFVWQLVKSRNVGVGGVGGGGGGGGSDADAAMAAAVAAAPALVAGSSTLPIISIRSTALDVT